MSFSYIGSRNKWIALAGAIVFGLSPYVVSRPQHPEVMFIATIPLALYAFDRGVEERRWKWLGRCRRFSRHHDASLVCIPLSVFC